MVTYYFSIRIYIELLKRYNVFAPFVHGNMGMRPYSYKWQDRNAVYWGEDGVL